MSEDALERFNVDARVTESRTFGHLISQLLHRAVLRAWTEEDLSVVDILLARASADYTTGTTSNSACTTTVNHHSVLVDIPNDVARPSQLGSEQQSSDSPESAGGLIAKLHHVTRSVVLNGAKRASSILPAFPHHAWPHASLWHFQNCRDDLCVRTITLFNNVRPFLGVGEDFRRQIRGYANDGEQENH
jgi:hypothetical protein